MKPFRGKIPHLKRNARRRGFISIVFLFLIGIVFAFIPSLSFAASSPPGLGQCHWIGGPIGQYTGVKWGYSSSTPFDLSKGDSWAAIETAEGQYNWSQLHEEVNYVKSIRKNIWLQIQVADTKNKEHNIPKWALAKGVEVYSGYCGNSSDSRYWTRLAWLDVSPFWNDPRYLDQSEAVRYTQDNGIEMVKFPVKIPAVWDPKFQDYYISVLLAMKREFRQDIDNGTITAVVLMSGGHYGESFIGYQNPGWGGVSGTPDVLNPACSAVQSMAKIKGKTPEEIAKKSSCSPQNTIPGNTVELCTQNPCPTEYGSFCYVFDDYFIQAMKRLIARQAKVFDGLPLVWQDGGGLSGTGRTSRILMDWANTNYGSRVFLKFNGWAPHGDMFNSRDFNDYGNTTRHGYEPKGPYYFSRSYWNNDGGAANWCDGRNLTACLADPMDTNEVARTAIAQAIKEGIAADRSSFLCMQSDFYSSKAVDQGAGKHGNEYYFNPDDNTPTCANSEINVAQYGVGFCPGYLNYIFSQADNLLPSPPLPTFYPDSPDNPTVPDSPDVPTNTPIPTPTQTSFCASCQSDKIPKEKGNANCDNLIDEADFRLWKEVFQTINNQQPVSEEEAASIDFNCQTDQKSHAIDLIDLEIWRRNAFPDESYD